MERERETRIEGGERKRKREEKDEREGGERKREREREGSGK